MSHPEVVMYTNPRCSWCVRARALFAAKGIPFTDINVEQMPGSRDEMRARSGRDTVPQIFICGRHVGGYDDAHALELSGELDELLATTC
jgi:glutaredoxin 3